MRKSRFSEEQIRLAVEQAEAGLDVTELCRKYGVSQATFYRWRSRYSALSRTELQELRELKKENDRLKKIVNPTGFPGDQISWLRRHDQKLVVVMIHPTITPNSFSR